MNGVEVRAHLQPWNDWIELLILQRVWGDGRRYAVAKPIEMATLEEGAYIVEPSLRLTREAAQQLMDNLWQCGLRPTEGAGSAGALAAVQEHLKDMRRLVFTNEPSAAGEGKS